MAKMILPVKLERLLDEFAGWRRRQSFQPRTWLDTSQEDQTPNARESRRRDKLAAAVAQERGECNVAVV